ncbi:MAG TPA: hypothetical protein VLE43_03630 [Candidatus Saccharimonadia bacterium]|nr:hypothetical protein [Candidatus Saccharimonadia bacterium]
MNDRSAVEMVRRVCESFAGGTFTLGEAAQVMVRLYPGVPAAVFGDGWEDLLSSKQLADAVEEPSRFRMSGIEPVVRIPAEGGLPALTDRLYRAGPGFP